MAALKKQLEEAKKLRDQVEKARVQPKEDKAKAGRKWVTNNKKPTI